MCPSSRAPAPGSLIGLLCLYRRALPAGMSRGVIVGVGLDKLGNRLGDCWRQGQGSSEPLPRMPQRVERKARDLAPRQLHGEVEGSRQTSHSLVIDSVELGEEPIQHRRCTFGGSIKTGRSV